MPKNSRPDIQVLEDRIVRLKAQLLEYKDIRLYKATKVRLSEVDKELAECRSIIESIVSNENISSVASSSYIFPQPAEAEFDEDGDLSDSFLMNLPGADSETSQNYSPKDIVSMYAKRIQGAFESEGSATGIVQINQFWQIFNGWYQNRFTPEVRNPNFHFKSNRIHEWVDLLIIAAGHALHNGLFPAFVSDTSIWIDSLNTSKDEGWVLPYSVMRLKQSLSENVTSEAVLIEQMVKPFVYDASFYLEDMRSIYTLAAKANKDPTKEFDIRSILQRCPKLVKTSSFDVTKYDKEVQ